MNAVIPRSLDLARLAVQKLTPEELAAIQGALTYGETFALNEVCKEAAGSPAVGRPQLMPTTLVDALLDPALHTIYRAIWQLADDGVFFSDTATTLRGRNHVAIVNGFQRSEGSETAAYSSQSLVQTLASLQRVRALAEGRWPGIALSASVRALAHEPGKDLFVRIAFEPSVAEDEIQLARAIEAVSDLPTMEIGPNPDDVARREDQLGMIGAASGDPGFVDYLRGKMGDLGLGAAEGMGVHRHIRCEGLAPDFVRMICDAKPTQGKARLFWRQKPRFSVEYSSDLGPVGVWTASIIWGTIPEDYDGTIESRHPEQIAQEQVRGP